MSGRPRNETRGRFPGGRIRPIDAGITVQQLHRLRAISRDPWLESRIGQLLFLGHITQTQADCAWEIAKVYGRYERAMGLHRTGASPAYEYGYGYDQGEETDQQIKRRRKAARRYGQLIDEINALGMGARMLNDLERLCVDDLAPEPMALPKIKQALDKLTAPLRIR